MVYSPTPVADAYTMFGLVNAVFNRRDTQFRTRATAKAHVLRFAGPALHCRRGQTRDRIRERVAARAWVTWSAGQAGAHRGNATPPAMSAHWTLTGRSTAS